MEGCEERIRNLQDIIKNRKKILMRRVEKCIVNRPVNLYTLIHMCAFTVALPFMGDLPCDTEREVKKRMIDLDLQEDLQESKVLNWCRTLKILYPLRTLGDGNCLMHAVSMAMWGIHDCGTLLRRLVYTVLVEDVATGELKKRWRREKNRINDDAPQLALRLDSKEWEDDWDRIVKDAEDVKKSSNVLPYECLEEIHVFVLANILKRPIVVVADSVVRTFTGSLMDYSNVRGVYLPVLWPAEECVKSPIVLAYHQAHFVPLVAMEDSPYYERMSSDAECGVALVMHDMSPIPIHFLLQTEERNANGLLQNYLQVTEVTRTNANSVQIILTAKINHTRIAEEYNIMPHYFELQKAAAALESSQGQGLDRILISNISMSRDETRPVTDLTGMQMNDLGRDVQGQTRASVNNGFQELASVHSVTSERVTDTVACGASPERDIDNVFTESAVTATSTQAHTRTTTSTTASTTASANTTATTSTNMTKGIIAGRLIGPTEVAPSGSSLVGSSVEPTAPNYSLLSRTSETRSNSFNGPTDFPSDIYPSAVDRYCTVPGCEYFASKSTYPTCHEHDTTSSPGTVAGRHSFSDETLRETRPRHLQSLTGPTQSRSLEHNAMGGSNECGREGCVLFGPARCNGLCPDHFLEEQRQKTLNNGTTNGQTRTSGSTPQLRRTQSERKSSAQLECSKRDCHNRGKYAFSGLCDACYHKPKEGTRMVQNCKTEGCTFTGMVENGGFCSKCALAECARDAQVNGMGPSANPDMLPEASPEVVYPQSGLCREQLEHARQFSKCKSSSCTEVALDDPHMEGYCTNCYRSRLRRNPSGSQQHGRPYPRYSEPPVTSGGRNDDLFGSPRQSRHSLGLETITEPTEQTTYQEELEAVPKCWNPWCSRPGLNAYHKLCMECYKEMLNRGLDRNPPLPAAMLFPSRPTRTVKAPKAEHCLNSDCDRYGDPNLHGYCSRCLPLNLRAPPAAPSGGHYIDAITEIEKATKSGQRSCKTRGCLNYGNPRCAGYCHNCFQQQLIFS